MRKIRFVHPVLILLTGMILSTSGPNDGMAAVQPMAAKQQPNADPPQETGTGMFSPEIYRVTDQDDAETRLLKEQVNCLQAECESMQQRFAAGLDSGVFYFESLSRLAEARLDFHSEPKEQRQVLTEQLEIVRTCEDSAKRRVDMGLSRHEEAYRTTSFRIKAELALLRFDKAQAQKSENPRLETGVAEQDAVEAEVGTMFCDQGIQTSRHELRRRSIFGSGRNRSSGCRCP